jgi:hypothetical protein
MEELATIGVIIFAIVTLVAFLARWFLCDKTDDYIDSKEYTIKDFYTRKRR